MSPFCQVRQAADLTCPEIAHEPWCVGYFKPLEALAISAAIASG